MFPCNYLRTLGERFVASGAAAVHRGGKLFSDIQVLLLHGAFGSNKKVRGGLLPTTIVCDGKQASNPPPLVRAA